MFEVFKILIGIWNILRFPKLFPKTTFEDLTKKNFRVRATIILIQYV